MKSSSVTTFLLAASVGFSGCSSDDTSNGPGTSGRVGIAGSQTTAGSASGGSTATGGSTTAAGSTGLAGSATNGGSTSNAGSTATGGTPDSGGTTSAGAGGTLGSGGVPNTSDGQLFGTHTFKYPAGTKFPTGDQAARDTKVAAFYDKWKAQYLKPTCGGAGMYLHDPTAVGPDAGDTSSEVHGYGMILIAMMAGHDPDAQKEFDGMLSTFRAFPSINSPDLFQWTFDGTKCTSVNNVQTDSAADGDIDIGYALLLADKQWGTSVGLKDKTGKLLTQVKYLDEAKKVIAALKAKDFSPSPALPLLGDWDKASANNTRPSDFMPDHFRAFARVTGDAYWTSAVDAVYQDIDKLHAKYGQTSGLMPDFVVTTNAQPSPAAPNFLEDVTDGDYAYNACRVPWHISTDWIVSGDARPKAMVSKINGWLKGKTGKDSTKIVSGYKLDGTANGDGQDMPFFAPFAAGAFVSADEQAWTDEMYKTLEDAAFEKDCFGDSIRLFSMLVISGNWWTP